MASEPERIWIGWEHASPSTHDGRDGSCTIYPVPVIHDSPGTEARTEYVLASRLERYEAALREIQEGKGRFSLDSYEHARNAIEDMKELARAALNPTKETPVAEKEVSAREVLDRAERRAVALAIGALTKINSEQDYQDALVILKALRAYCVIEEVGAVEIETYKGAVGSSISFLQNHSCADPRLTNLYTFLCAVSSILRGESQT